MATTHQWLTFLLDQGKGIGTKLIKESLPQIKSHLAKRDATIKHIVVTTRSDNYAQELYNRLQSEDITGFVDHRDEKIGRKIRDAEVKKIPLMLIVGEKERDNNEVAVRRHGQGDVGTMSIESFIDYFAKEKAKSLNIQ